LLNPDNPISWANLQAAKLTAASISLELQQFEARGPIEIENAFSAMVNSSVDAVEAFEDAIFFAHNKTIADHALARRLPLIGYLDLADVGGLMAYGVDFTELFCRTAVFVDKIVKGAKPGDLPVEQPS
jgi:putative ABC transport system substrate-binding protein